MYQLRNLIHRSSVPDNPEKDMKAAEDFMRVVLEGYVVAAASQIMDSKPWNGNVAQLADEVVTKHVRILPDDIPDTKDKVYTYACEVLSLGLLWYNYLDAIREGDGKRVMMMWKFLLVIFKKTGHRNYAKEAAVMLIQYHFLLSDCKASQLRNSRFVNTQGRVGCNIACDLYMEHLNRRFKGVIRHMGSNIQPPTLVRAAKSIGLIDDICRVFEQETAGKDESERHRKPSNLKDFRRILSQLIESEVFRKLNKRKCSISLRHCLLDKLDEEQMHSWIIERVMPNILYR